MWAAIQRVNRGIIFAIPVVGFLIFWVGMKGEWLYDDLPQVRDNPYIRSIKFIPHILSTDFHRSTAEAPYDSGTYRPVALLSYTLDYQIFGGHPWGFHLTNHLLHAINVLLLLLLLGPYVSNRTRAFAGLLFAVCQLPPFLDSRNARIG